VVVGGVVVGGVVDDVVVGGVMLVGMVVASSAAIDGAGSPVVDDSDPHAVALAMRTTATSIVRFTGSTVPQRDDATLA
jgi:threonine dehydrogenase-like Zn-dependent dehydrogenase